MGADYRKYKTPFFEIEIGDSSGQRMVKLPHHILRLVEKVEIMETFDTAGVNTITLHVVEGSREPASPDSSLGTGGLYKIPSSEGGGAKTDISGSITNRTGVITDLRFSGSSGITFLTAQEQKKGKVDNRLQENIVGKTVTRKHKLEPDKPVLLFQERNQVRVTWGYKEDPSSVRSLRAYILHLTSNFPDSGPVKTIITCEDTGRILDQVSPVKGIPFGKRITSPKGNSIVSFEDESSEKMIRDICTKAGIKAIVSSDLPSPVTAEDKQKIWLAGESFHQFMTKLAEKHNAYYKVEPDPETGIDTLIFIKKSDFESKDIIADKTLTTYKAPGSLIKAIDVKVDFGGLPGNAQAGMDKEGNNNTSVASDGLDSAVMFKGEGTIPLSPVDNGNESQAVKGLVDTVMGGKYAGTLEVNPTTNVGDLDDDAKIEAEKQSRTIALDFTAIGSVKFTPGVIEIRNIGVRYSGRYRVITVTHTLDSNGYITKGTATSFALSAGGVPNPEAIKGQEIEETQENRVLFEDRKNDNTIRDQYDRFRGIK